VATDVGGCWEVVNGNGDQFGAAGLICSVEDAPGIAGAIFELSANSEMWYRCSHAGKSRVNAFYRSDLFLDEYRKLYSKYFTRCS
ncbi:MAG: hypothetical protein K8R79_07645, partial [Calditrichales bacterium]|nr:hypothetical protein [Calditrichales bacterium]